MEIVIPVHDALSMVKACVESVLAKTPSLSTLIFVDDFSQPDTTQYLLEQMSQLPQAYLIRTGKQRWFTRAANLGLRLIRHPWMMLLNSDCVVDTDWLEEMEECRREAEAAGMRVGLVGSTLSADEKRRWTATGEPHYVTGHAWLCSMEALYDISNRRGMPGWYLDETQPSTIHINSDRLGCYELNRAGWATIASFKSAVGHVGGQSWGYNLAKVSALRLQDVN